MACGVRRVSGGALTGEQPRVAFFGYNFETDSKRGWRVGPQFAKNAFVFGVSPSSFHHMTANKKSTSKVTKSPTPATKPSKPAKAKAPAAAALPPAAATPAPVATARPVAAAAAPKPAPAVKASAAVPAVVAVSAAPTATAVAPRPVAAVASKPVVTTITARVNVGFGNALYLRGDGAGLSWNRSVQMTCMSGNEWLITIPESARPVLFKFLINDTTWSMGPDYSVIPGTSTVLSPTFEG